MKASLRILAILSLFFINSCGGDDNVDPIVTEEEEENKVTITTEKVDLKDVEIGIITVDNFTLNQQTYNAKFGDLDIILAKNNSTELSFLVPPNIDSGTYNLAIDFSSNSLGFKVTKTTLSETPEKVISNFVGDYALEISETIALFDQGNVPPELLSVKDNIDKAITDLNNLPENDKIIAAKFIENNSTDLNALEAELAQQDLTYSGKLINKKCDNPRCYLAYGAKVIIAAGLVSIGAAASTTLGAIAATLGAVVVGVDAIVSLIRGKRSILISKVKVVINEALTIYIPLQEVKEIIYNTIDGTVSNFSKSQANKIENETAITFKIKPTFRTLDAADESSTDTVIKTFVDAYLSIKDFWNQNFASNLGSLPNFNDLEQQKFSTDLSYFSLDITDNSENVTKSEITGTVEEFSVTFTNETDLEQDFTFDVIYNDGENEAKSSLTLTINFDEIFLEKVSGDNQSGVKNEELTEPIVIKVADKDGLVIKDVDVEFNITAGQGSLSTSTTKTDTDGLAKVSWTLGDNLDSQTMEVLVKNSAGENISTSPVTFNATSKDIVLILEKVSGDNQTGEKNEQLAEPLVVKVVDDSGNPIQNINVEFNIASGNGSLSTSSATTNSNGNAQVNWTLGDNTDAQTVEVIVKKADGTNIDGSPINFSANLSNPFIGNWKAIQFNSMEMGEFIDGGYIEECDIYTSNYTINSSTANITNSLASFSITETFTISSSSSDQATGLVDCDSVVVEYETDNNNLSDSYVFLGSNQIDNLQSNYGDAVITWSIRINSLGQLILDASGDGIVIVFEKE